MIRVGQLNADKLGSHYRLRTRDGIVEGQLWRVEHSANKFEETTFGDPEPTHHAGQTSVTIEIGDVTGTFAPNTPCETIDY